MGTRIVSVSDGNPAGFGGCTHVVVPERVGKIRALPTKTDCVRGETMIRKSVLVCGVVSSLLYVAPLSAGGSLVDARNTIVP